jgi:SNF2 family DNA or RNA helicase
MPNDLTLQAYIHWTETGVPHLRVRQSRYYSDDLAEALRAMGSPAQWDPSAMEWDCPLLPASIIVLQKASERFSATLQFHPDLQTFADEQLKVENYEMQVRKAVERVISTPTDPLPGYVTNTMDGQKPPMRHQQVAYQWALRVAGLLLAWEPGLGKTRGAVDSIGGWYRHGIIRPMSNYAEDNRPLWLAASYEYTGETDAQGHAVVKQALPSRWAVKGGVLVVCPKAVMRTWSRECKTWQNMTSVEITGTRPAKLKRRAMVAHVHIINYESLPVIEENEYDAIIVDESHRCANRTAQTSRVLALATKCKRRLLLTGTPVSNSLQSVFYQMLIVDGGRSLGANHQAFLNEFFVRETVGKGIEVEHEKSGAAETVAQRMSRACYFLRKEEALDLPPKLHTPVYIDMAPDQARYYEKLKAESIAYIQDSQVTVEQAVQKIMKLMQICQGIVRDDNDKWKRFANAKQDTLILDLQNELKGRKVIVWCRFTEEIDTLVERLTKEGIWCLRFDGTVSHSMRNKIIEAWNTDYRYTVFVAQLAMGEGIELVANESQMPCFLTYYLGLDYRFVNWKQTQDRIHRITQKYACYYKYLLTPNGIDNDIYQALIAKESTANTVHKVGKDFFLSLLTQDTPNLEAI